MAKTKEKPKDKPDDQRVSTLKELLRDKPRRGRPRRMVPRENVYVMLSLAQKAQMAELATRLPRGLGRPDVPDLAVSVLTARMEALRTAVAGRTREIPEGVTDLVSLYLLWDVVPPLEEGPGARDLRLREEKRDAEGHGGERSFAEEEVAMVSPRHSVLLRETPRSSFLAPGTERWTSIRLSPQQALELGRVHGTLNAAFGASRSEVFALALALLAQFLERRPLGETEMELAEVREIIFGVGG